MFLFSELNLSLPMQLSGKSLKMENFIYPILYHLFYIEFSSDYKHTGIYTNLRNAVYITTPDGLAESKAEERKSFFENKQVYDSNNNGYAIRLIQLFTPGLILDVSIST